MKTMKAIETLTALAPGLVGLLIWLVADNPTMGWIGLGSGIVLVVLHYTKKRGV